MDKSTTELTYSTIFARSLLSCFVENCASLLSAQNASGPTIDLSYICRTDFDTIVKDRVGIEAVSEATHKKMVGLAEKFNRERRAREKAEGMMADDDDDDTDPATIRKNGLTTDINLPPWLGNVNNGRWEIRKPFVIPAIRWVLRGLIASGHVMETETFNGGQFR